MYRNKYRVVTSTRIRRNSSKQVGFEATIRHSFQYRVLHSLNQPQMSLCIYCMLQHAGVVRIF